MPIAYTSPHLSLQNRLNSLRVPTLILFRNGEAAQTFVGVQPKEVLIEEINKHI